MYRSLFRRSLLLHVKRCFAPLLYEGRDEVLKIKTDKELGAVALRNLPFYTFPQVGIARQIPVGQRFRRAPCFCLLWKYSIKNVLVEQQDKFCLFAALVRPFYRVAGAISRKRLGAAPL